MRFLTSAQLSETNVWGSDAGRDHCRRTTFAYQSRFGQPALFVTLTPRITSVDSIFDAPLSRLPGWGSLRSAAFKNDVASARLFMRNMDAFIEHVLGVDPARMQHKPFDGLFGCVNAYFGMVETQGGGTLHAHFLALIPYTSAQVQSRPPALQISQDLISGERLLLLSYWKNPCDFRVIQNGVKAADVLE
ncbi:hypothetical protein JG688_00017466 [Phytophthora aleatoria]|uniref:Helitron helicase-like domain-containing protein n=1 Tax=Phytophthora aleatoria TaxID=2496075 RepID=A0A8J5MC58_9STRA|nr:hypothetical protein JG688_00017466 [Phytophthora aleatoria]